MKQHRNQLILMVGLPQSGKSSEARQMGYPIVNRDSIRKTIGGSIRYFDEEGRVSDIERIMADSLFNAGHQKVVIDACHLKPSYRNAWIRWTKSRNIDIYQFHVMTSLDTCLCRAARNFPDEPNFQNVIKKMWSTSKIDIGDIPEKQSDNWN